MTEAQFIIACLVVNCIYIMIIFYHLYKNNMQNSKIFQRNNQIASAICVLEQILINSDYKLTKETVHELQENMQEVYAETETCIHNKDKVGIKCTETRSEQDGTQITYGTIYKLDRMN